MISEGILKGGIHDIASRLLSVRNDENMVMTVLRMWAIFGQLEKMFQCGPVASTEFEAEIPGGRIDLLIHHQDGGITIVEAKAAATGARAIVGGAGQLMLYEQIIIKHARCQPAYINKWLVAPTASDDERDLIGAACDSAGIFFLSAPGFDVVKEKRDELVTFIRSHGSAHSEEAAP